MSGAPPPAAPRPICFMIMPFGVKPSGASEGTGAPATVNFDALWDRVLRPVLEDDLGLEAVRADQDLGPLIIQEMIERLALSDVVVADVSTPNANVYYEIGVRHAAHRAGCVLVAADWARPTFDLAQVRGLRYPLPDGHVGDEAAAAARAVLRAGVGTLLEGPSLVWSTLPGYPGGVDQARTSAFRQRVARMASISAAIAGARRVPPAQRRERALEARDRHADAARGIPGIAVELLLLLRDAGAWDEVRQLVESCPAATRAIPVVQEQYQLAVSKGGDHRAAIDALTALIAASGDTSERRGLLGGRYKKLAAEATNAADRAYYLDLAIEEYDRGMRIDLNDYYPASNLPRLLRERGHEGDAQRAHAAATLTVLACERALARNPADPWIRPTLLGAAFDAGDVVTARRLLGEMRRLGVEAFHLDTTLHDLERAVALQADPDRRSALGEVLDAARALLPAHPPAPRRE